VGGGAKSYDGEKAWSSTHHSIVSALQRPESESFQILYAENNWVKKSKKDFVQLCVFQDAKRTFYRNVVFHVFVILVTTVFLLLLSRTFRECRQNFGFFPKLLSACLF
jgi:hypothetical protein